jgi:hypothetical protein
MLEENAGNLANSGVFSAAKTNLKRRKKSYLSKIWRRSVYRNLTNSKLGWYGDVFALCGDYRGVLRECQINAFGFSIKA